MRFMYFLLLQGNIWFIYLFIYLCVLCIFLILEGKIWFCFGNIHIRYII